MYGDCQVLLGGNGNGNNPNFNFMSTKLSKFNNIFSPLIPIKEENGVGKNKEEEMLESGSGSEHIEGVSVNDHEEADQNPPTKKKKRYHRHTPRQIQEMEALFKECPHPDDKQRLKLSQDLGLKPRQVKFWFQNRRTQLKAQQDRQDNAVLRAENESLRNENYRLQATLRNVVCPNCGGAAILGEMGFDEHQLRIENAHLKDEYERVCCLVSQYASRSIPMPLLAPSLGLEISPFCTKLEQDSMTSCPIDQIIPLPFIPENSHFNPNPLIMDGEKPLAMKLAVSSMNELVKMCSTDEPLWVRSPDSGKLVLNVEEYNRMFSKNSEFRIEATKDSAVVIMNSITLVDAFLDANQWMKMFPSIISNAKTLQAVHSEVSDHSSGSLHLMYAELQVPTPLIATREVHFLRYCHHNIEKETWIIVDFPMEGFQSSSPPSFPYYKRRPSGCIIQDMPNGYSTVTWIEHSEVEDAPVHQVFAGFVASGMAFGAGRWLATLQSQCERLASLMARNVSDLGAFQGEGKKCLVNLAKRMTRTFYLNMSNCNAQSWTALSDSPDDTVRITTRKVTEQEQGNPLILTGVSTSWLPYKHNHIFDFLRDERRRSQIEVLSNGNSLQEIAHIANGSNPGNSISLLRINVASNSSQSVEFILQESCVDDSGSTVIYATVDMETIQRVMNGQDQSGIPLLPLGFIIYPMNPAKKHSSENTTAATGSLLTVGIQIPANTTPTGKLNLSSVAAMNHHLCSIIEQINGFLKVG